MVIGQMIADGISIAGILIIVALGLGIIFGVMKVINMAHGDLIMIGAYTTYVFSTAMKLPFFVGLIAAFIVTALVGALIEILVIRRLYGRILETLLATYGVSLLLQQLIRMIFGPGGKSVKNPLESTLSIGSVVLPHFRLFIILFSVFLLLVVAFVIYKTRFGIQLRTVTQNREMSECLGINTSLIDTFTFAFGAGMAGIAGAVLAPLKTVSPTMGMDYLVDAFMVVVLGGVGSLTGTVIGSGVIGEANQLLTLVTTETLGKILVFILVIIVIRFKPEGLFKMERR